MFGSTVREYRERRDMPGADAACGRRERRDMTEGRITAARPDDLRAGKPELTWPASESLIDHYLVCVGCVPRGSGDNE
jgi:hypothetical protein